MGLQDYFSDHEMDCLSGCRRCAQTEKCELYDLYQEYMAEYEKEVE